MDNDNSNENYKSPFDDSLVDELTYRLHYGAIVRIQRLILKKEISERSLDELQFLEKNSPKIEKFFKETKESIEKMNERKNNKKK